MALQVAWQRCGVRWRANLRLAIILCLPRALFGSCYQVITNILPRFGVKYTLVDGDDTDQWRNAITAKTKLFFLEDTVKPDP